MKKSKTQKSSGSSKGNDGALFLCMYACVGEIIKQQIYLECICKNLLQEINDEYILTHGSGQEISDNTETGDVVTGDKNTTDERRSHRSELDMHRRYITTTVVIINV